MLVNGASSVPGSDWSELDRLQGYQGIVTIDGKQWTVRIPDALARHYVTDPKLTYMATPQRSVDRGSEHRTGCGPVLPGLSERLVDIGRTSAVRPSGARPARAKSIMRPEPRNSVS